MPETEREGPRRATLFVRSDLPRPARERRGVLESRLDRLREAGQFDEVALTEWDKHLPLDGSCDPAERERYEEFRAWARSRGVELTPFFDTRECTCYETGTRRTVLVLPAVCLSVRDGDRLRAVAPHAGDSGTETIEDCLDRIERDTDDATRTTTLTTAD